MDEAIRTFMLDREFQPMQASTTLGGRGELQVPDCDDIYRPALESAVALLSKLGVKPEFRSFKDAGYTLENCQSWLRETSGEVTRLTTKRNSAVSLANDDRELIGRLEPFSLLEVNLEELLGMKSMRIHFGSTLIEYWDDLRREAETEYGAFLFRSGFDKEKIYCILLMLPDASVMAEERLAAKGFTLEELPNAAGLTGVPSKRIAELRTEADAAEKQGEELTRQLAALAEKLGGEALARYSFLKYMSEGVALRRMVGVDGRHFFLCGWMPASEEESFERDAKALGCECRHDKPGVLDAGRVPVKFKKGKLAKVFSPFVDMYGVPAYGEADPRVFLALTYCLFFGMMFGDIGQGVVLILVGLYMYKKRGMWLGGILATVGVPAIIFGFIYGSVFGNEHLLPGFKVLEGDGVVTILLVSAVIGIMLILLSGVLNILTCFRQRDYRRALFSANGITGVLFLTPARRGRGAHHAARATRALQRCVLDSPCRAAAHDMAQRAARDMAPSQPSRGGHEHGHDDRRGLLRALRGRARLALQLPELPASRRLRHHPRHHDDDSLPALGPGRRRVQHLRPRHRQRHRHGDRGRPRLHPGAEA